MKLIEPIGEKAGGAGCIAEVLPHAKAGRRPIAESCAVTNLVMFQNEDVKGRQTA